MRPIGYVKTEIPDKDVSKRRAEMVSEIVIADQWQDALTDIEAYSHLFVLFWMHKKSDNVIEQRVHPRGDKNLPLTGVFATRSGNRPNPIGLAVVELLQRKGTHITVRRLDAYDGTPILDLKPYDDYDVFQSIRVPEWWAMRCRKK